MAQVFTTSDYDTPLGKISVTPIAHGALYIAFDGKIIQVDPYSEIADYSNLPKADLILLTHDHYDHLDKPAIRKIVQCNTKFIGTKKAAEQIPETKVLSNGEYMEWNGIKIAAVPAYNLKHGPEPGKLFHPKGDGNGYILNFADFRLYIAGDTELIPEMYDLGQIDVAFLPKNLPFTMDDDEFVEAAKVVNPKVLYPYHYSKVDKAALAEKLPGIEIK